MGKSLCMISFGLFALVFMFAFQNSDAQGCGRYHAVGSLDSFTYSNSSAVTVEWRLETAYDGNKSIICNFTSRVCSSHPELSANVSMGTTVCTINQMQTNYKSLYVVVDGSESLICPKLNIYAHPENLTCFVIQDGYSLPTIRFNATKFFPKIFGVTYFMSNGTDVMIGNRIFDSNDQQLISTQNGLLPYFKSFELSYLVDSRFLHRGTNTFFISMKNGDATDPGFTSSLTSIDIYPAVQRFAVNGDANTQVGVSFNSSVTLTCNVGPVPAETITLSRRGAGKSLNTSETGTSITYVISAFGCSDLDEYVCTVDDGRWSKALKINVSTVCPPVTARAFQNNVTLTTENGGSIFIPLKVISFYKPTVNLWILEDGMRYAALITLYTIYTELTSAYFYDVNVALHEVHDSDFRDYALVITSGNSGDGIIYFFTASQKTTVDVRGVAIGVGVVAVVRLIVVVVIIALLVCRRRRRRAAGQKHVGETEMVKPQHYDSTESSDASWGIDSKSREAAAPKNKMPPRPVKTATRSTEQTYEPMTENSKPHRPHLPPPPEDVYEIEPNGDSQRPQSYYGNMPDQPIYGNA